MLFTKKLLERYLAYRRELAESADAARLLGRTSEELTDKSFISWLADAHEERDKRRKELLKWRRTKQKMAQRKNAEANCVAVLCLDATTNRDAETLDSELRVTALFSLSPRATTAPAPCSHAPGHPSRTVADRKTPP